MGRYLVWLLFSWKGRMGRAQWWLATVAGLLGYLSYIGLWLLWVDENDAIDSPYFVLRRLLDLPFAYSYVAVNAKRLHDLNHGGFWALILAVYWPLGIGWEIWCWYHGYEPYANLDFPFALIVSFIILHLISLIYFGFVQGAFGPNRFGDDPQRSSVLSIPGTRRNPPPSENLPEGNASPPQNA